MKSRLLQQILLGMTMICLCLHLNAQCTPGAFTSQQDIDDFTVNPGCTVIDGPLQIDGSGITNLDGLSGITEVSGNFEITNCPDLQNLMTSGNMNLTTVGGDVFIGSTALLDLSGLGQLDQVNGAFYLNYNQDLSFVDLYISSIYSIHIEGNDALQNIYSLTSDSDLEELYIGFNNSLNDISGLLASPVTVHDLFLQDQYNLQDLSGLEQIMSVYNIAINNMDPGTDYSALTQIGDITGSLEIANAPNTGSWSNLYQLGEDLRLYDDFGILEFPNLSTIGSLQMDGVPNENSLPYLPNLGYMWGSLTIQNCSSLTNLDVLQNLWHVELGVTITDNPNLLNLNGMSGVTYTTFIEIANNNALTSLSGFENFDPADVMQINIYDNALLSICNVSPICSYLQLGGDNYIVNNAAGCADDQDILGNCNLVLQGSDKYFLGVQDENWMNPLNWNDGTLPTPLDTVLIFAVCRLNSGEHVTVAALRSLSPGKLVVGQADTLRVKTYNSSPYFSWISYTSDTLAGYIDIEHSFGPLAFLSNTLISGEAFLYSDGFSLDLMIPDGGLTKVTGYMEISPVINVNSMGKKSLPQYKPVINRSSAEMGKNRRSRE